jgi:glucose-6-phosphate isomerase
MDSRNSLDSWLQLEQMAAAMSNSELKNLFAEDCDRFDKYSLSSCGILYDFSKNKMSDEVKAGLVQLAADCGLDRWREAMFSGEAINHTEKRAVLHTALRSQNIKNAELAQSIANELTHIKCFSEQVREGAKRGYSDKAFTDVVCLGVGGSNLGPEMVTEALPKKKSDSVNIHYIASVDAVPLEQLLATLSVETTLFVVSSKTFTTTETLLNAGVCKAWLLAKAPLTAVAQHFVAVTVAVEKALAFGLVVSHCFKIWDWVGGRFSLWSAIGLPIAIGRGFEAFETLLAGAEAMDKHFCQSDTEQNIPIMMALVGVWNTTFLNINTLAVLPYDQSLHKLPAYLQQAEMESNGKSVNWQGEDVTYKTCPIIWGQTGINGQHAFYQLLHQGTQDVATDFIVSVASSAITTTHHEHLLANCFAQSQALMMGMSASEVKADLRAKAMTTEQIESLASHKVHNGNGSSSTLLLDKLDAYHLGQLIALYEHKIFVQGVIWQIYSFDQWGVELGKVLAKQLLGDVQADGSIDHYDSSTNGLLNHCKLKHALGQKVYFDGCG